MKQPFLQPMGWGVVLPLVALITLGVIVAAYPTLPAWDAAFLLRLHRYATPQLNRAIALVTDLGTVWGVLPATVGLAAIALWQQRWRAGLYLLLTMLGTIVLNPLAKRLWQRVRPALWEGVPVQGDYSFPSGHATYSLAFVLMLVLLTWEHPKRIWIAGSGAVFVVLIGFSRVYLGMHYPSDILGGWLLATAWAVGLHQVMFRDQRANSNALEP